MVFHTIERRGRNAALVFCGRTKIEAGARIFDGIGSRVAWMEK
jgi:hypothetical protein